MMYHKLRVKEMHLLNMGKGGKITLMATAASLNPNGLRAPFAPGME
jgi:hypothetical protein